jgi:hypothetical protein
MRQLARPPIALRRKQIHNRGPLSGSVRFSALTAVDNADFPAHAGF